MLFSTLLEDLDGPDYETAVDAIRAFIMDRVAFSVVDRQSPHYLTMVTYRQYLADPQLTDMQRLTFRYASDSARPLESAAYTLDELRTFEAQFIRDLINQKKRVKN